MSWRNVTIELDDDVELQDTGELLDTGELQDTGDPALSVEARTQCIWDMQTISATWLNQIEDNTYTHALRVAIDQLMIGLTVVGSKLEQATQSIEEKPCNAHFTQIASEIDALIETYIGLKTIADNMIKIDDDTESDRD